MYGSYLIIESSISNGEIIRNFGHPVLPQCHIHLFLNHFLIRFYLSLPICRNNVIFFSKCQYLSQLHASSFHISEKTFQCVSQNRQSSFLSKINCMPLKLTKCIPTKSWPMIAMLLHIKFSSQKQFKCIFQKISYNITLKINYELLNHIFFYCTQRRERPNIIFIHAYQHIASKNS